MRRRVDTPRQRRELIQRLDVAERQASDADGPLIVYVTPDSPKGRVAFSVAETAELLGVSEYAVRRAVRDGQLHETRFNERGLVIPAWSIERFLRGRGE